MKETKEEQLSSIVSIKDVANKAHVSTATVSRAINKSPFINKDTYDRVMQAIQDTGYKINYGARMMRNNKSNMVGIIVPDMVDDFFYRICDAAIDELWENGYMPILAFSKENLEREKGIIEHGISRKMDGFIMCVCDATRNNDFFKAVIEESKVPIVFFDRVPQKMDAPTVNIDNEMAVRSLVRHLVDCGYHKIAYIKNPSYMQYASMRCEGYVRAMEEQGLPQRTYMCRDITIDAGREMAEMIVDDLDKIDAVVTCDDFVAIGLMYELQKRGLNIPTDIAISGIGGSVIDTVVTPNLTTIDYPKEEIGRKLAQLLIDSMKKRPIKKKNIAVDPIIRYRASTERDLL